MRAKALVQITLLAAVFRAAQVFLFLTGSRVSDVFREERSSGDGCYSLLVMFSQGSDVLN